MAGWGFTPRDTFRADILAEDRIVDVGQPATATATSTGSARIVGAVFAPE